MSLVTIIVLGLAAYRVTRLLTSDTISAPLRAALIRWAYATDGPHAAAKGTLRAWVVEGATCAQCLGVWIAAGALAWWWLNIAPWAVWLVAIAGVQSLLASVTNRLDGDD